LRVLITADAQPGALSYGLDLATGLSRLGVETVLALTGSHFTEAQRGESKSIALLEVVETGLSVGGQSDRATIREAASVLADLATQRSVDIVQLNLPSLAAGVCFGVPVVAAIHNCAATWWESVYGTELPPDFAWRTELMRAGLEAADIVISPTSAFAAATRRAYGLEELPRVVHYGHAPLPTALYAPHDLVFTAGQLWDAGKNLDTLDAAARQIPVPIHAAGPLSGPNGAAVMVDNIHCLGNLGETELARWLSARPVFVSTALYEPFGLAVLEAASAGCPLILSDIPTFRELWDEVAIFVPPRDEAGFTRAIANLVGDDFERAVIGRAAKERAALYTPDIMASQMATIYRSLLPAVPRPVLAAARAAA